MKFKVEYTARAERDLYLAYGYIAQAAPLNAMNWLEGLETAVSSLEVFPKRCPIATESEAIGLEVREFLYGAYRVLFVIQGRLVRIVHIRHSGRDAAQPRDLV